MRLYLPEGSVEADLCEECRKPLVAILKLGRPVVSGPADVVSEVSRLPASGHQMSATQRRMEALIRGVPKPPEYDGHDFTDS